MDTAKSEPKMKNLVRGQNVFVARIKPMKNQTPPSSDRPEIVFLFDVDNTLLDNDRVIDNLRTHLEREVGSEHTRQ